MASPANPVHYIGPVAVTLARGELRKALETMGAESSARPALLRAAPESGDCLDEFEDTDDARAGVAWYNSATVTERRHWHYVARSAVPADAWEAYKAGGSQS